MMLLWNCPSRSKEDIRKAKADVMRLRQELEEAEKWLAELEEEWTRETAQTNR